MHKNSMAWRIEESVIRGEIDNRIRGQVIGRIWFAGRAEPMELKLTGNGWRDLAGRCLAFTNPEPKTGDLDGLNMLQQGSVGDITASRKVKVPEISLDELGDYYGTGKPFPWHWGNSLYLEWFSAPNGRVVIESANYELKIVGEPTWEMTPAEEDAQRQANGATITGFMADLDVAADAGASLSEEYFSEDDEEISVGEPAEGNERPQTEKEAAVLQAWGDRLVDHIRARLAREGEGADYEKIMEEEIARLRQEHGEPGPAEEQQARHAEWIEEMNRAGKEAVTDEAPGEPLQREHPLAARTFDLALGLMNETNERGWLTEKDGEEHPVAELVDSVHKAGVKLAGALNHHPWPPGIEFCARIIVRLIKARVYLDDALRAMESCQEQKLMPNDRLAVIMVEVIDLAHDADLLLAKLRRRLERSAE